MRTRITRPLWRSLLAATFVLAGAAIAQSASDDAEGVESPRSEWNAMNVEKIDALELVGDLENGKAAYEEECASCHQSNAAGRPDGTFPQLAGQHDTVLIKQIADIRAGRRDNPVMHPYSMKLIDAQEIADVAIYLEGLPIPLGNGKGPGTKLPEGERLYQRDCARCHGKQGEGNPAKFFPVLAGQHYEYLLRQVRDIASGRRRNANPEMVKIVKGYHDAQLQAVVDFMSRLEWPRTRVRR